MTSAEFRKLHNLPPAGHDHQARAQLQGAKPQRHPAPALDRKAKGEGTGAERLAPRTRICIVCHRVRPLDPDNAQGGAKQIIDQLRYAGLIEGDEPWRIILEVIQEKVPHYANERTEITLTYP